MKTKEIQLLAILAVIAAGIITLSMWSGRKDGETATAGQNDDESTYSRSDDSEVGQTRTVRSDELDELIRLLGDSGPASGDGAKESKRDKGPLRDLASARASRFGEDSPLQAPPGQSIDDRLADTEPEEIPLTDKKQAEETKEQDEPEKSKPVIHNVTRGETLSEISQQYYGTSRKWRDILEANKDILESPERLRPDMSLLIPKADEMRSATDSKQTTQKSASLSATTAGESREYTVQRGDTLWDIAVKHYGDGSRHKDIKEANKAVIRDGNVLRAGTVIVIPE